jgi:hypothetical protein
MWYQYILIVRTDLKIKDLKKNNLTLIHTWPLAAESFFEILRTTLV